ncbi:helix-turn-helix domain-containing protein [Nonomuraea sp. NPDC026600]|uniref:helix-turn-helix transcriptional regulator n=1 Tax=Nonomuraea sp. NPDC026600 TaxID=3155363 RepID=UPI0033C99454
MNEPTLDQAAAREGQQFLKVKEVAARLRVTPMTIYRAIDNGDFPGTIRIRDSIRVPIAAYDAYLKDSEIETRADEAKAAVERMRTLIDSYPPGSDFVRSGAARIFRSTLDGTLGQS